MVGRIPRPDQELTHDRQEAYRQIVALSTKPQDVDLAQPVSRFEPQRRARSDGVEVDIPNYKQHLLCDEQGSYPAEMNDWEKVVTAEMQRDWDSSSGIAIPTVRARIRWASAYTDADSTKIVRPDFIFFAEQDGKVVADMVDPHGIQFADAVAKLQGLALYAETHPGAFRRVEAIAEVGGKLRVLDLTRADVRQAVKDATSAETLYTSALAGDYS
jgi:type III restriction enzyme